MSHTHIVRGVITLPVALKVKVKEKGVSKVIEKAYSSLNSFNIQKINKIKMQTVDGIIHTLDVCDVEIEWEFAEEVTCENDIGHREE